MTKHNQAIQTKYVGPSARNGPRIRVITAARSIFVSWDHALDSDTNHYEAADALAHRLGWADKNTLHGGTLKDGSHVFVLIEKEIK